MDWLGLGHLPIIAQIIICLVFVVAILTGIYNIIELLKTNKENKNEY